MAISCRVAYLGFHFGVPGGGGVFELNLKSWEYLHSAKSLLVAFGGMLPREKKIKNGAFSAFWSIFFSAILSKNKGKNANLLYKNYRY